MSERSFEHLVVIGSSAGGVKALSEFVSTLPEDFPAPIVLAQHLDPERESNLNEILTRRSALPVRTVTDETPLEGGVIFVVPANRHVSITDSSVGLQVGSAGRPKPSVDLLLSTAAEVYGERLIAIVLTGRGSDGASGARAVSKLGGTVVVQDPESAAFPGMPGALQPNVVDITADLERIGPILEDLVSGVEVAEGSPREGEEEELDLFLEEVRERHGVDFRSYKRPTILRRLKRRMVATGCADLREYRGYLDEHPAEYRRLVNTFLIKVTEFFRDPELFAHLKEEVLPRLVEEARQNDRQLRVWSAGCATGEEAYSLAIAISEALGDEAGFFPVRIFATDVDEGAISFARPGIYPASSLGGLSEEQKERYFVEEDGQYQVKKTLRSMIVFSEHDLARRSPFPRIDLCVSRNVLIYFTGELQKRALELFASSLRDGGVLVLGKAETAAASDNFAPIDRQLKVYRREGDRLLMPPLPAVPSPAPPRAEKASQASEESPAVPDPRGDEARAQQRVRSADEGFVNRLPMAALVVDRRYDIRAINAEARRLLSIHGVVLGEDFLHALRGAPYEEVRGALDAAMRGGGSASGSASTGEFAVDDAAAGETRYLRLDCYPRRFEGESGPAGPVMVVVNDVTQAARARRELEHRLEASLAELSEVRRGAEDDVARLELHNGRLAETNRDLEKAVRELTELSEELQSAYEGALLSAEEAQAATEEVETLNEELQATNEELETLNEELQATIEELNTTNEDLQARTSELQEAARDRENERRRGETARRRLQALLEQAPAAIAEYEGPDLVVRFVNQAFLRLFDRREEDVLGKPFAEALPELEEQGRGEPLRRVYGTGEPYYGSSENYTLDPGDGTTGELFLDVVCLPLRDAAGDVEGVLNQMVDVTGQVLAQRRAEQTAEKLREERSRFEAILDGSGEATLAVNADGTVLFANEAFAEAFGEVPGGTLDPASLNGHELLDEDGARLQEEASPLYHAARGESFTARVVVEGEDEAPRRFEVRGRPLDGAEGGTGGGVISFHELSAEG